MAYATPEQRLNIRADRKKAGDKLEYTLQVRKKGRESEIACDSLGHALTLSCIWHQQFGAEYVEIFRVNKDGTLKATIGRARGEDD